MLLGYNTNGFAHHNPITAIGVLHAIGYRAVGLTLDHGVLNPRDPCWRDQATQIREHADRLGMTLVVETGARFLLDPWMKHRPVLVSPVQVERHQRVDFLVHAIEAAQLLGGRCVSLWAGVAPEGDPHPVVLERLVTALVPLVQAAAERQIDLAFEPEPGMAIETLAQYADLKERLAAAGLPTDRFRLTADVGHLHCLGETPIVEHLTRHAADLSNVHIEDMCHGVHEHLEFGLGEIDFPPVIDSLAQAGYVGPLCVELSRQSHDAPAAAQRAFDFLTPLVEEARMKYPADA